MNGHTPALRAVLTTIASRAETVCQVGVDRHRRKRALFEIYHLAHAALKASAPVPRIREQDAPNYVNPLLRWEPLEESLDEREQSRV